MIDLSFVVSMIGREDDNNMCFNQGSLNNLKTQRCSNNSLLISDYEWVIVNISFIHKSKV